MKAKKMTQKLTLLTFTALFIAFMFNACSDVVSPDNDTSIISEETDMQDVFGWNQSTGGEAMPGTVPNFSEDFKLIAGQTINAGTVRLQKRNNTLSVITLIDNDKLDGDWGITGTHVWVGNSVDDIPKTGNGNLRFNQFYENSYSKPYPTSERMRINLANDPNFDIDSCPLIAVVHASINELDENGDLIKDEDETAFGGKDKEDIQQNGRWWFYMEVGCNGDTGGEFIFSSNAGNRR